MRNDLTQSEINAILTLGFIVILLTVTYFMVN